MGNSFSFYTDMYYTSYKKFVYLVVQQKQREKQLSEKIK
jgi:hypothetical protein